MIAPSLPRTVRLLSGERQVLIFPYSPPFTAGSLRTRRKRRAIWGDLPLALGVLVLLMLRLPAGAQAPIAMAERLSPGSSYHVSCRVQITGKLTLPDKMLDIEGQSVIEYDERILTVSGSEVESTVRLIAKMDFERKIGTEPQRNILRPAVKRMVIMRKNNLEVPFSPDGPMKWNEIDLVRTDVFTPALGGMLPREAVKPGDSWKAGDAAVRELTDLRQIKDGQLTCTLDKIDQVQGKPHAKIAFQGTVSGPGENGPTKHELDGFLYFDLTAKALSYVSLKGTEFLLNAEGMPQGKVSGSFVLTREPVTAPREISEGALGLVTIPNDDNTLLLFEDEDSGLRFQHSRRWRTRIDGPQIKFDDPRGNGLVMTPEGLNRLPTADQFQKEARGWLTQRKGSLLFVGPIQAIQKQPTLVETFAMDADLPLDKGKEQRVGLVYAVVRDASAGATLAATLVTNDRAVMQREVEKIAVTLRVGR